MANEIWTREGLREKIPKGSVLFFSPLTGRRREGNLSSEVFRVFVREGEGLLKLPQGTCYVLRQKWSKTLEGFYMIMPVIGNAEERTIFRAEFLRKTFGQMIWSDENSFIKQVLL